MHSGMQPLCSLSMRHLRGWKLSWEESWGKAPTGKNIAVPERRCCRWSSIPLSVWNVSRTHSPGKPLRTSISTKPERSGFCSVIFSTIACRSCAVGFHKCISRNFHCHCLSIVINMVNSTINYTVVLALVSLCISN